MTEAKELETPKDQGSVSSHCSTALSFDDAIRIARGCFDYSGGYRSNDGELAIYHHGIQTVINALNGAKSSGLSDLQSKVLHTIGSDEHNEWCESLKADVEFEPLRDFIDKLKDPSQ